MNLRFYLILLLAAVGACGLDNQSSHNPSVQTTGSQASGFPRVATNAGSYQLPAEGELYQRLIDHLDNGSKESMRFAFRELPTMEAEASAEIARRARLLISESDQFGALHNYCKALGGFSSAKQTEVLLEIVEDCPTPVVRSAAVESLIELEAQEALPRLLEVLKHEQEAGPRDSIYGAIGALGGPVAAQWLEKTFVAWINQEPGARLSGHLIYPALLAIDDDQAITRLKRLPKNMAKPFLVKALARRAVLGDSSVLPELRPFLNLEYAPGPGVRSDAVGGLIALMAWPDVLEACSDPDPGVITACIQGLHHPDAMSKDIGKRQLLDFAKSTDPALSLPALQILIERGDASQLDPILVRAKSFPHGPGSSEAINFLRQLKPVPPQAFGILQYCWGNSEDMDRVALLRVMAQIGNVQALDFFVEVINDTSEANEVRNMAMIQLGNFGIQAEESLLALNAHKLPEFLLSSYGAAIGRLADESSAAFNRYKQLSLDQSLPVPLRVQCLLTLPNVFGLSAYDVLIKAREQATDVAERAFVNSILHEFF